MGRSRTEHSRSPGHDDHTQPQLETITAPPPPFPHLLSFIAAPSHRTVNPQLEHPNQVTPSLSAVPLAPQFPLSAFIVLFSKSSRRGEGVSTAFSITTVNTPSTE
ncbi:hypothetical protein PBY51_014245 [Eleginops maclovinus]|uniref:Uncharacterized protein n=1 Tax=Eleginops maclovinus TaxID=56733 RepID=A0AAN7WWB1_ELEMC|nr:hypothetical protein PBY51_014245 [Eleginops maclovinus]